MKTDSQLQQDVMDELKWDPAVHASQIGVECKDGVVTLAGEVSSFADKWRAEQAAQRVTGVTALAIDLTVNLPQFGKRSDADIARSAENILSWTNSLHDKHIQVMVENGWLTLTGKVEWQYERQDAINSVRHLIGVTGVSNQITIQPVLTAELVKADIVKAMNRRARTEGRGINVEVKGGEVTLSGTIQSWAERDMATRSAWGCSGVRRVFDQMNIAF
jgi:osmotically-inducible protein OsmY